MAGNKCSLALYDEPTAVNVACVCAIFGFVGELIPCLRRGRIKYFGGLEVPLSKLRLAGNDLPRRNASISRLICAFQITGL